MDTDCPFEGDGDDVEPVLTSAYCRPEGVVVNCRFGTTVPSAAALEGPGLEAARAAAAAAARGDRRMMDRRDVDDVDGSWR